MTPHTEGSTPPVAQSSTASGAVAAVHEEVVVGEQLECVLAREALPAGHDRHGGVEGAQPLGGGVDLRAPHVGRAVQVLAVQVAELDDVVVDDAETPPGAGREPRADELGQQHAAEPARADDEHARVGERVLRGGAEAGQSELARVAGGVGHGEIVAGMTERRMR